MTLRTKGAVSLDGLPIEILLEIYQGLDIASIYKLSQVNKHFLGIFQQRKSAILIPVLTRDFSPFNELIQVHIASLEDLDVADERYRPRTVILRRFLGDKGYNLTPSSRLPPVSTHHEDQNGFTQVVHGQTLSQSANTHKTVVLTEYDLDGILRKCRTVQKWEELFPQMRWYHEPENCRSLRVHERHRFRRAFYRWWLYGVYFHGEFPRPHVGLPAPFVRDIRTSILRYHPTSELLELMDLVETMKDVILHYICPRLDPNHLKSDPAVPLIKRLERSQSLLTNWTDQSCWARIVKTYGKLGPEKLMYYFENICSYSSERLVAEVNLQQPGFALDQASIQIALRCALDERGWLEKPPSLAEDSVGGIVDFDDERDAERLALGGDASPDGLPAAGSKLGSSQSRYSPRGDDGSNLEDYVLQQSDIEERFDRMVRWLRDARRW